MPTHFGEGQYVTAPWHPTSEALTVAVWVNWESGPGPLVKTADGAWGFPYENEVDGRCAYRLGDEPRVLALSVSELRGRWAFFALSVSGDEATLWIDEGPFDTWPNPVTRPQAADLVLMEDAIGSAAHFAVFEDAKPQDKLRELWEVGTNDPDLLAG
jgi:hypothetical protein